MGAEKQSQYTSLRSEIRSSKHEILNGADYTKACLTRSVVMGICNNLAPVAEWKDGRLTVWAGVEWPQRAQRDLARVFDLPLERVRAIVPDMGGGFGGKHSAEAAEEAARLAKAAGRPVSVQWTRAEIKVHEVCEAFECGPIINPANLTSQVQGGILMGLGGALREEMQFEDGKILNAGFSGYLVPRFEDVPKIDVHLINKTDIPSAGGGETPIIAIAPAIGNAVFAATGIRLRSMPMQNALREYL